MRHTRIFAPDSLCPLVGRVVRFGIAAFPMVSLVPMLTLAQLTAAFYKTPVCVRYEMVKPWALCT